MGNWKTVGTVDELDGREGLGVEFNGEQIGIFEVGGELFAVENVCPHAYALLSHGFVEGRTVECGLHGAVFDIPTGKMLKEPGGRDIETRKVRLNGNDIQLAYE